VEYILFVRMLLLFNTTSVNCIAINCSICYEDIVSNELDTLLAIQEAKHKVVTIAIKTLVTCL